MNPKFIVNNAGASYKYNNTMNHINDIEFGLLQTSSTMEISEPPEKMRERALNNGYKNGTKYNGLLSQMLYSGILPTPSAGNEKSGGTMTEWGGNGNKMRQIPGANSRLATSFVMEMMGFPKDWTELPFQNGEEKQ